MHSLINGTIVSKVCDICEDGTTSRGPYCKRCADASLGLMVAESTFPSFGLGLFATKPFSKYEIIDRYKGELHSRTVCDLLFPGKTKLIYGITNGYGDTVNAWKSTHCLARFANDSRGTEKKNNAVFISTKKKVYLEALRDINPGEEIFASYGEAYFKK